LLLVLSTLAGGDGELVLLDDDLDLVLREASDPERDAVAVFAILNDAGGRGAVGCIGAQSRIERVGNPGYRLPIRSDREVRQFLTVIVAVGEQIARTIVKTRSRPDRADFPHNRYPGDAIAMVSCDQPGQEGIGELLGELAATWAAVGMATTDAATATPFNNLFCAIVLKNSRSRLGSQRSTSNAACCATKFQARKAHWIIVAQNSA
jgi:hypothetical protein